MDVLDFKEILVKKPFFQITSHRPLTEKVVTDKNNTKEYYNDIPMYRVITQEEMLRQYFPSGHKINNPTLYPDIWKQNPEDKQWYRQPITRCALGFQQVIATKHIIHIIGNDVQFELSTEEQKNVEIRKRTRISENGDFAINPDAILNPEEDEATKMLSVFKKGWNELNMEIRWYEAVDSIMKTADAAVVGFFDDKGNPGFKTLSFMNDDKLYPHYNSITGKLELFARQYFDYDEDGVAITEWVEVWDEKYLYRAKRGVSKDSPIMNRIKGIFGIGGFEIVSQKPHGFNFIPVAYHREEEGACWQAAEDTIEKFEEALSYFFENNKAFAFPILVVQGEGVELIGDQNGAVKSIAIDSAEGDAKFLDHHDVSASYNTLLSKFYDLIYEQSFTVKPPELKSGDLPGVALKLLYSPAIERAIQDTQKLQPFLDDIIHMVRYAWGLKENCQASLLNLGINAWIEPYVHQNDTELTTNLSMAVQNNIISCKTASERLTKYAKNDEYSRITKQMKEKMLLEVEKTNLQTTHQTNENIRKTEIEAAFSGQDVNTGYGEGNEHINETDENGNRPDENNWDEYDQKRF